MNTDDESFMPSDSSSVSPAGRVLYRFEQTTEVVELLKTLLNEVETNTPGKAGELIYVLLREGTVTAELLRELTKAYKRRIS